MIYMTLNQIKLHSPSAPCWKKLLASLNKTTADDEPLALLHILKSNGVLDAIWCMRVNWFEHKELYMQFVNSCVTRAKEHAGSAAGSAAGYAAGYAAVYAADAAGADAAGYAAGSAAATADAAAAAATAAGYAAGYVAGSAAAAATAAATAYAAAGFAIDAAATAYAAERALQSDTLEKLLLAHKDANEE